MWRLFRPIVPGSRSEGGIWPIRWASTVSRGPPVGCRDSTPSKVRHRGGGVLSGLGVSDSAAIADHELRNPGNGKLNPSASSKDNAKVKYPAMTFDGHIIYSRTTHEVEKAAREILDAIEAQKQSMDEIYLGLDLEWKPSFRRGIFPGKAAVLQICVDPDHCYVMHIFHSGIPCALRDLLENRLFTKVGVGIAMDARKLSNDFDVSVCDLKDLSSLANLKFGGTRMLSLSSLTEKLIGKQLKKLGRIRLGNWEAAELSREQLSYAATDAFVSWHLYQVLSRLPDARVMEL